MGYCYSQKHGRTAMVADVHLFEDRGGTLSNGVCCLDSKTFSCAICSNTLIPLAYKWENLSRVVEFLHSISGILLRVRYWLWFEVWQDFICVQCCVYLTVIQADQNFYKDELGAPRKAIRLREFPCMCLLKSTSQSRCNVTCQEISTKTACNLRMLIP